MPWSTTLMRCVLCCAGVGAPVAAPALAPALRWLALLALLLCWCLALQEENEMLVEFASHVDRDKLEELSKKFQRSKASVPTRWVGLLTVAVCVY